LIEIYHLGYIGGHLLAPLQKQHPEYQLVALVRTESQVKIIKAAFPTIETVIGDLDIDQVLQTEAAKADVVLSKYCIISKSSLATNNLVDLASADHVAGVISLIKGMGLSSKKHPRFLHISGTGIMTDMSNGPGNESSKVYHDMSSEDINTILSFDVSHIHRDVEEAVIATAQEHGVTAAIISPPMIHGVGNGPVKKRSIHVPVLIENVLKRGKAFQVLEGKNIWNSTYTSRSLFSGLI
jgi:nucleoside-diphosphate-sugar epimerase